MRKALSYMLIGAAAYGIINMMVCNNSSICRLEKKMKRLKRNGMEACNKVKAMF